MRRNILWQPCLCLVMFYCTSCMSTKSVPCFTIPLNTAYPKYSYISDVFVQKDHILLKIPEKVKAVCLTITELKDKVAQIIIEEKPLVNSFVNIQHLNFEITGKEEFKNQIMMNVGCDKIYLLKVKRGFIKEHERERIKKTGETNNNTILFTIDDYFDNFRKNHVVENKKNKQIGLEKSKC